jgi:hypothetical protein
MQPADNTQVVCEVMVVQSLRQVLFTNMQAGFAAQDETAIRSQRCWQELLTASHAHIGLAWHCEVIPLVVHGATHWPLYHWQPLVTSPVQPADVVYVHVRRPHELVW